MMTPEGWILNTLAVVGSCAAAYQAWGAKGEATKAKDLSEPTGNGFAKEVRHALDRIEGKIDTHIHDHLTDTIVRENREEKLDAEQQLRDQATREHRS